MIRLPTFTFINAPSRSGKTTLAHLIDQQDQGLAVCSFADPLRAALTITFYPEEFGDSTSLNLRDPATKLKHIPLTKWTNEQFLIDYSNFLKAKTNEFILGDLAKSNVEAIRDGYSRFLFDDARTIGDVAPFINAYGAGECLLLHIDRQGAAWRPGDVGGSLLTLPAVRHFVVTNNGDPDNMLKQLEGYK